MNPAMPQGWPDQADIIKHFVVERRNVGFAVRSMAAAGPISHPGST
jgi:hypothetical protein